VTQAHLTSQQRELIEEFGLLHEQMGGTRMTGRVSAWLLLCDPPIQSLTEIAEGLGVSKAAASGAARSLLQSHFVERVGEPGQRGDFYRAVPADPDRIVPLDHVRRLHALLGRALQTVAEKDQAQTNHALMHDLLDFTAFVDAELPALLERWVQRRAGDAPDASGADNQTPDHHGGTP
jgi:hypothetical protein